MKHKKRILTGDRPTGKLHLGHYIGTLKNRVDLQESHEIFVVIADLHSLTTRPLRDEVVKIDEHVHNMVLDYLAIGLDPKAVTIYRQSAIGEQVAYLALLFAMITSIGEVERIPTLKEVMRDNNIKHPSLGLLSYPVLQAADILSVKADTVPVGKDQEAHIELARSIARKFNNTYGELFPEPNVMLSEQKTLIGTDGKAKMSKSLNNTIYLSDSAEAVKKKVMKMYTDPSRVHGDEPGRVEDNPVFVYHDAFNPDKDEVADLKERYQKGTVKDVAVKEKLAAALNAFLDPIRTKRAEFENEEEVIADILTRGAKTARAEAEHTLKEVLKTMGLSR